MVTNVVPTTRPLIPKLRQLEFEENNVGVVGNFCVPPPPVLSMDIYRCFLYNRWFCFDGGIIVGVVTPMWGIKWIDISSNDTKDHYLSSVTLRHDYRTTVESSSSSSSWARLTSTSSLFIVLLWWTSIFLGPSIIIKQNKY